MSLQRDAQGSGGAQKEVPHQERRFVGVSVTEQLRKRRGGVENCLQVTLGDFLIILVPWRCL